METTDEHSDELIEIREFAANFDEFRKSQKTDTKKINEQSSTRNVGLTDKIREHIIFRLNLAKAEGHDVN